MTYIWNRGIFCGGNARNVSRNLQADRYMSNSCGGMFRGQCLTRAPRTILDSLRNIEEQTLILMFIEKVKVKKQDAERCLFMGTYLDTSMSDCRDLFRRANIRI